VLVKAQPRENDIATGDAIERVMLRPMPTRRLVTLGVVAAIIEFLVDDAASNMSGQSIVIDGARTARWGQTARGPPSSARPLPRSF
jgi:3-hydroxybutyrate dehydrogenase